MTIIWASVFACVYVCVLCTRELYVFITAGISSKFSKRTRSSKIYMYIGVSMRGIQGKKIKTAKRHPRKSLTFDISLVL